MIVELKKKLILAKIIINLICCPPDSPIVTLSLGSTLNPHDIKEGDDVYFECNVRANPREHRISWYHNVSMYIMDKL